MFYVTTYARPRAGLQSWGGASSGQHPARPDLCGLAAAATDHLTLTATTWKWSFPHPD